MAHLIDHVFNSTADCASLAIAGFVPCPRRRAARSLFMRLAPGSVHPMFSRPPYEMKAL